jgi:hypothetical protein
MIAPVQNNITIPARPASVVAPQAPVHVITEQTQAQKLGENPVYICRVWDDQIEYFQFQRNILNFITEQNLLLDYYENTVKDLNGGEDEMGE